MEVAIKTPISFSEIGQRSNNEDSLFPNQIFNEKSNRLFVVCDGMGGADQGEVASKIVCDGIVDIFSQNRKAKISIEFVVEALNSIHEKMKEYLHQNPFVNRMGTTLALLKLDENDTTVVHIGDSRVYQIRKGKIIFKTNDHKQVNEMVKAGVITSEQAKTHPWRNKLSKAIICQSVEKSRIATPEINFISDIQKDDYFFLCSDGVLEGIDDQILTIILNSDKENQIKVNEILDICKNQSKDNYSGHLIQIDIT
ncbi:PP2C family protein-serine/threonine phosphatase [Emticicia sp. SJ17W-69]|uniref:PP2C family protein-serine/threonine phosphatase n=1 Tax=Emticicia sp. SJ17W-69 TaxID=3421657 RepID=UPI003EB8217F